jgi:hypothetical protein
MLNTPPIEFYKMLFSNILTHHWSYHVITKGVLPIVVCRTLLNSFPSIRRQLQSVFHLQNTPMFYATFCTCIDLKTSLKYCLQCSQFSLHKALDFSCNRTTFEVNSHLASKIKLIVIRFMANPQPYI